MLQRLFARNVSEERIEDDVDHAKNTGERDVLRERSAVILERLARKQAAARKDEIETRRIAREAADRVPEEAPVPEQAPVEAKSEEVSTAAAPAEEVTMENGPVQAATDTAVAQDFEAHPAAGDEQVTGMADPSASPPEATSAHDGYFSDDAPLRPDMDDQTAARHEAPHAEPPASADAGMAEPPVDDAGETEAYEPAAEANPAPAPEVQEDPEVLEQIRRKAEEAKARIAARLQAMQAEEEAVTDASTGRLDLGEDVPPVSSDDGDD